MDVGTASGDCCRRVATDRDVLYCPECGRGLYRCLACHGLLTSFGLCPACIDLELALGGNALLQSRAGECLGVPFVLRNRGSAPALTVKALMRDGTNMAHEPVPLTWTQLEQGRSRTFTVDVGPFAHAGVNSLRLTLIVAAPFHGVEEVFAFTGGVSIDVDAAEATQIVQHFNLAGADFGTAGMVVANPQTAVVDRPRARVDARAPAIVALERAERYELERGYRGYDRLGVRIPRDVEFVYTGFPASDAPPAGPLLRRPILQCGRNGRPQATRPEPDSNDLCLRIYDPASGLLDRDASQAISRRVCHFVLQNDRLCVRPLGGGVGLNGQALAPDEMRILTTGDSLTTPLGREHALTFTVTFRTAADLVTHVRFDKVS